MSFTESNNAAKAAGRLSDTAARNIQIAIGDIVQSMASVQAAAEAMGSEIASVGDLRDMHEFLQVAETNARNAIEALNQVGDIALSYIRSNLT